MKGPRNLVFRVIWRPTHTLREAAGFTQEELATIADLSVPRGQRAGARGTAPAPCQTVRALSAALDLTAATRDSAVRGAHDAVEQRPLLASACVEPERLTDRFQLVAAE
jgi:hypothetical protein